MKIVLWRVAKRLSYIEDARCLKVNKGAFCWFDLYDYIKRTVQKNVKFAVCFHDVQNRETSRKVKVEDGGSRLL